VRRRRESLVALAAAAGLVALAGCAPLPLADTGGPAPYVRPHTAVTPAAPREADDATRACEARLAGLGVDFTPVADRSEGGFCVVTGAVVVHDRPGQPDPGFSPANPMMTCPLAEALATWRRESVERAARDILGVDVRRIDHLGVYACRNVNSAVEGRPSAHARAQAIDVAGFDLGDGRRVTVADDWAGDTPAARFLHQVRDGACRLFGTTLSPDYNALHANHLHLEAGPGRFCR
jgi:hypothetical protein